MCPHFKPEVKDFYFPILLQIQWYIDPVGLQRHERKPEFVFLVFNGEGHGHGFVNLIKHVQVDVAEALTVFAEFLIGDEGNQWVKILFTAQGGHLPQTNEQGIRLVEAGEAKLALIGIGQSAPLVEACHHLFEVDLHSTLVGSYQLVPGIRCAVQHETVHQFFELTVVAFVFLQLFTQFRQLAFQQCKRNFKSSEFISEINLKFLCFQRFIFDWNAVEVHVS